MPMNADHFYIGPNWREDILTKVSHVLDSMERPRAIDIRVTASLDEVPIIRYTVEELLLPRKQEEK